MPRDGTHTRSAIMDAAQALILEHGYTATSVDAVIGQAGLAKGAFFYHFKTKADLAKALVLREAERDAAHMERTLERAENLSRDPVQQMLIFLGLYEEEMAALTAPYPGCLYASFVYEVQQFEDATMDVVRGVFTLWRQRIGEKMRAVMAAYPPRLPANAEGLADMILAAAEGSYVISKVERRPDVVAAQFRHCRQYLELLFAPAAPEKA